MDVVGVAVSEELLAVIFAFEVYPDLCETALSEMPPLQIVEAFAERFGIVMHVGDKSSRFFFEHEFPLSAAPGAVVPTENVFVFQRPKDRHYLLLKASKFAAPSFHVAIAFCVDVELYAHWVMGR